MNAPQPEALPEKALLAYLLENVRYEDGELFWTKTVRGRGAGQKLGCPDRRGYVRAEILRRKYPLHRLVFFMHHGWLPEMVDHKDRDTSNNRIDNLRACRRHQNVWNSKLRAGSKSGVKGVHFDKRINKWIGSLSFLGRRWAGRFKTLEEAAEAVHLKRTQMHGEFARAA